MAESGTLKQAARSTAAHMAFAFLAMGGWAVVANRDHGALAMAFAFVVQGLMSALLTLALKRWLEQAYGSFFAQQVPPLRRLLPPLISCLIIGLALWLAHRLAGTPEILATIAVPWSVSTLYAFAYTATLGRGEGSP